MDSRSEARHSSLLKTLNLVKTSSTVWTGDTPFEDDFDVFKAYLETIEKHKQKHLEILIGYAIEKSNKMELLITDLLFVMPSIRTWAARPTMNRNDIKGMASIAESKLLRMADTLLLATAQVMKKILDENPSIIDPLYVPAGRKTIFENNIQKYEQVIEMPLAMRAERAVATQMMQKELKAAMKFRRDIWLDTVRRFRESHSDFFGDFKHVMTLHDNPSRKYSLMGKVRNEAGEVLAGVRCFIGELDKTVRSGKKGVFKFKKLPAGEYTLLFTRYGCEPVTMMVAINDKERTDVEVVMKKKLEIGN